VRGRTSPHCDRRAMQRIRQRIRYERVDVPRRTPSRTAIAMRCAARGTASSVKESTVRYTSIVYNWNE